ncbi:hypothetical protein Q5424_02875 [Conexibacter sp. JD483]|uniref:hypothetical protein n=1 Tax=unclassified Conexibacter TaxID=2627773 RepID=UPI00271A1358|nr:MULTISPECIES: hypothetical protein [unclassified Conexibacter]MDO8185049.1 hypothetical protein [Conexibacter sp. CPCC 205706]MDO8196759.1 hypothetical protein [Conexibacter sp. CPCC 205762]MDR9368007.1 hypothetical protein [Conexibacter sp. JD483]
MSALAGTPAEGQLRHKAEHVRELIGPLRERPSAHPAEVDTDTARAIRAEAYSRLEDAILDLSNALPQGTEDYDARKLFEFLVGLRRAIDADPEVQDAAGDVELHQLMMRDVLARIERRLLHDELDDPRAAVDFVLATLKRIPAGDLARLLGVSTKTIGAWRAGRPVTRNGERAVVLAQLLSYLRQSLTPLGIVLWFDAERDQLDGRTPLQLIEERGVASAHAPLVALARGSRGQLAG